MKATGKSLLLATLLFAAAPLFAAELVNINTASVSELDSLPEIGPTLAQRIVDYRNGPNGPFETKEEVKNVSGIGDATYDAIKDLITVGSGNESQDEEEETEEEATSTQTQTTAQKSSSKPPPLERVEIQVDGAVVAQAPALFVAYTTDEKDSPLYYGVRYLWNFGDGTTATEREVLHTYAYPGTYVVSVTVEFRDTEASTRMTVVVLASGIELRVPGDGSVAIYNKTGEELDIGGWMLTDSSRVFVFPNGTRVADDAEARFAPATTGIKAGPLSKLLFPNGMTAASIAKPSAPKAKAAPKVSSINAPKVAAQPEGVQLAAVATSQTSPTGLLPWAGLGVVILGGIVGAYYSGRRNAETKSAADEFEIE